MNRILIASALILASAPAFAGDMNKTFDQVCKSNAVMSEKLNTACEEGNMPDVVKAGDRFKNVGIGAEVNVLAANLKFFAVAQPSAAITQ